MRNLILVFVISMLSTFQSIANITPLSSLLKVSANEKSVVLNIENRNLESVSVIDKLGTVLFIDAIEDSKNRIKYNLDKLPSGAYTIKLNGENFVELYQTKITTNTVAIKKIKSYYRPNISINNDKLVVDISESIQDDVSVTILDEYNEVIYVFREKLNGSYQKAFDLKALLTGEYKVQVSTDYFSEQVQINR